MIATRKKTIEILTKYNLYAKKKYGQNFLIDSNIINKIVCSTGVNKETAVIEIGPGIGAMTEILSQKSYKVLCYEIDPDMVNILSNELLINNTIDNLKIINEDFLKVDLEKDGTFFNDCKHIIVVSNLPYYITTPIIFKLLDSKLYIDEMYFMVQKEVAERLTAEPKTKEYSSLSVLIKYEREAKVLFNVSRNCFYPSPNVDSIIVSMKRKKVQYSVNNEAKFKDFIQKVFAQKRKTIMNNIISQYSINKDRLFVILNQLNYSDSIRAEALSLEELIRLYNALYNDLNNK